MYENETKKFKKMKEQLEMEVDQLSKVLEEKDGEIEELEKEINKLKGDIDMLTLKKKQRNLSKRDSLMGNNPLI